MRNRAVTTVPGAPRLSDLSRRYDPSRLLGHFVLGRSLPLELPEWDRQLLNGWILAHEPSLPVQQLVDLDGSEIGWLLGHPIDVRSRKVVTSQLRVPVRRGSGELGPDFESWLYGFGGRFAAIVVYPRPVIYPDGGGTLPVLFDAQLECAASSPFLLCSPDGTVPDSPLTDTIAVCRKNAYFTFGITPHARAELLLANHMLDLAHWEQFRTWPTGPLDTDDVGPIVERVADTLERTLAAVAAAGRPNMSLTAGHDTRVFLACSRDFLDRFRFFTVAFPDDLGTTDLATVPVLARRFGLEHRILPWLEPSTADLELFIYRTGCLVGERRGMMASRSYNQLGGGDTYVSGVTSPAGHWGWRRTDDPSLQLEPEDLFSRFGLPLHPELLRQARKWFQALPKGLGGLDVLALYYYEMRGGVWGGTLTTAYPEAYSFALYPYAHRAIIEAELRSPWQYRRSECIVPDVIAARWKGLLDIPFNRPPLRVALKRRASSSVGFAKAGLSMDNWRSVFRRVRSR